MRPLLDALNDSLADPARLHAAIVHLPIAAAVFGLVLLLLLALSVGRSPGMRWACVVIYALGAGAGFAADRSGQQALARLDVPLHSQAAAEALETHEAMGQRVWLLLAAAAVLTGLTALPLAPLRWLALLLALAAGAATAGWVIVTAHHGGELVYVHGVGVPAATDRPRDGGR